MPRVGGLRSEPERVKVGDKRRSGTVVEVLIDSASFALRLHGIRALKALERQLRQSM